MNRVLFFWSFGLLFSTVALRAQSASCFEALLAKDLLLDEKITDRPEMVILYFWHAACSPCLSSFVINRRTIAKLDPRKVRFVSISVDPSIEKMETVVKKYKFRWLNWYDQNLELKSCFNIKAYPTAVLLNAQREELERGHDLFAMLNDSRLTKTAKTASH